VQSLPPKALWEAGTMKLAIGRNERFFALKSVRIAIIALGIIAMLALACNLFTPNSIWGPRVLKDSPVDVSLIEALPDLSHLSPEEQRELMVTLDEMGKLHLGNEDDYTRFGEDGVAGLLWMLSCAVPDLTRNAGFIIRIYDTPENAKIAIQRERENGPQLTGIQSRDVIISDDFEAALWPVYWNRAWYPPYLYDAPKKMSTEVRMGNVIIGFIELLDDVSEAGLGTNQALQEIVEALDSQNSLHD